MTCTQCTGPGNTLEMPLKYLKCPLEALQRPVRLGSWTHWTDEVHRFPV